jgi:hypothetical protein
MLYSDLSNEVNDRINNKYFSGQNANELFRAANHALRDINTGNIGKATRRVAYDFQRESTNLAYVSGTERYTLSSYITTLADLKWIDDVLINNDENSRFTKRSATYFRRRRGINNTAERMFADEYLNGIRSLLIYNGGSDTLNLIWYSNYLVRDDTTRQKYFTDNDNLNNQELLIPDEWCDCVIDLTTAYLYMQDRNEQSTSSTTFLSAGRNELLNMINNLGRYEKRSADVRNIRNEWGNYDI